MAVVAIALLLSACVVVAHPRHPPPPRLLSAQEAVDGATYFARSHGLVIDYTSAARLDRNARWHVDLGGAGGRDRALVVVDGYSGRVLSARLRNAHGEFVPQPAPPESGQPPATEPGPTESIPPPPESAPPPPPSTPPPPPAR